MAREPVISAYTAAPDVRALAGTLLYDHRHLLVHAVIGFRADLDGSYPVVRCGAIVEHDWDTAPEWCDVPEQHERMVVCERCR